MLIIGHRGASAYAPENTAQSFELAIEMGVDMIEFDARTSKSGEIFLLHDDTLDRTTNGKGQAYQHTMRQLKSFDAGKGQVILTLQEALRVINHRVKVNIEIKAPRVARRITKMIQHCVEFEGWRYDDFLVSSFQYRQLIHFARLDPRIPLAAILEHKVPRYFWNHAEKMGFKAVCLSKELALESDIVKQASNRRMPSYVWTVNDREVAKVLESLGVSGIFTDCPDHFTQKQTI